MAYARATSGIGIKSTRALPESVAGTTTVWTDRYDCSSYIIDNVCPPANPNSGIVTIGTGIDARRFDLATWATFTITEDAHVQFEINSGIFFGDFQTRIFSSTLGNTCPSPNPATDMLFEFSGRNFEYKCMPAGDYSIQILSSSVDPNSQTGGFDEAWTYGLLGTQFTMDFTVLRSHRLVCSGWMLPVISMPSITWVHCRKISCILLYPRSSFVTTR